MKKTPLNQIHRDLGGKMVDFGGWDMPVQYKAGTIAEHLATRTNAGLFDVSHMGEIHVNGKDAIRFVNSLTTNDVTKLVDGQAHYSALTNETGGVVDDLLVYRFGEESLLLVVNASTTDKDWSWIDGHKNGFDVDLRNASDEYCQIAVQGKRAIEILEQMTDANLEAIEYYHFQNGIVDGVASIISRTGYTGEDGFEIYADATKAEQLWNKFLDIGNYGEENGILPNGLAARNTLRLESAMSLYGHELSDEISPLEANLGWICKLNKGDFIGRERLQTLKEQGLTRKLVGFEMTDKGIARDEHEIYINGEKVGVVTSGSPAPYLKKNIGLAFVPPQFANVDQEIEIDVRGKMIKAKIVKTPFYKREK
ncbi:MAG: glycine cleavage system aminomethyltransferase GcvT [Pyrinomonadaceae bacterium]|nr:glycine cleavage system aminomethyltransferase GcvT [Pyrinomonadaceae bacterium]